MEIRGVAPSTVRCATEDRTSCSRERKP